MSIHNSFNDKILVTSDQGSYYNQVILRNIMDKKDIEYIQGLIQNSHTKIMSKLKEIQNDVRYIKRRSNN